MGVEEVALALLVVVVEVLDVGAKDRRCSDRQSVPPGLSTWQILEHVHLRAWEAFIQTLRPRQGLSITRPW